MINYQVSENGLQLIKQFEGCRLKAYKCPAGVLTIGYGHTGKDVKAGMTITEKQASELLAADTKYAARFINNLRIAKTQNQFDALVSFVFNIGTGNFEKSTLLKCIRQGASEDSIRYQWQRWNKSGGKTLSGLVRRRKAEVDLYFT